MPPPGSPQEGLRKMERAGESPRSLRGQNLGYTPCPQINPQEALVQAASFFSVLESLEGAGVKDISPSC